MAQPDQDELFGDTEAPVSGRPPAAHQPLAAGRYAVQVRVMLGLGPEAPIDRAPIARELTTFVLLGCGLAPD